MADEDQVKMLKERGAKTWNEWRKVNPEIRPDLSGADLIETGLAGVNLSGSDLREALLVNANLIEANLSDADLSEAHLMSADLYSADLIDANLSWANLHHADLCAADLKGSDLSYAVLAEADLTRARLRGANFQGVQLFSAYLREANLFEANLSEADLRRSDFSEADLTKSDFSGSTMAMTLFGSVDLSRTIGLDSVRHQGPSSIGIDTIYRSGGNIPEKFLRDAGVPEPFIVNMKSLVAAMSPVEFYSCFISYSHADKAFARRLHDSLQAQGVRCWLDEHQLLPGDDIYHEVDRGIRLWDKMLLCCSAKALTSWWVDNEIGTALEKEQQLMKDREAKVQVLMPLNLDGYLFSDKWQSGYQAQVRRRLAADFTDSVDAVRFDAQVERLIKALRADEGSRERPPKQRL